MNHVAVSTACLFPELTERSLEILLEMGVKHIELFLNSRCETEEQFAYHIADMAVKAGARCV